MSVREYRLVPSKQTLKPEEKGLMFALVHYAESKQPHDKKKSSISPKVTADWNVTNLQSH